jgi:hypothetical protein
MLYSHVFHTLSGTVPSPSVADPDPGSSALLTPGSGIRDGLKIRIRDEQPGSYFRELRNNFLVKILDFFMRIRDGKNSDSEKTSRIRNSAFTPPTVE